MRKPALTKRVIRGILNIEAACGGLASHGDVKDFVSKKGYQEALDAIEWAKRMQEWAGAREALAEDDEEAARG